MINIERFPSLLTECRACFAPNLYYKYLEVFFRVHGGQYELIIGKCDIHNKFIINAELINYIHFRLLVCSGWDQP